MITQSKFWPLSHDDARRISKFIEEARAQEKVEEELRRGPGLELVNKIEFAPLTPEEAQPFIELIQKMREQKQEVADEIRRGLRLATIPADGRTLLVRFNSDRTEADVYDARGWRIGTWSKWDQE